MRRARALIPAAARGRPGVHGRAPQGVGGPRRVADASVSARRASRAGRRRKRVRAGAGASCRRRIRARGRGDGCWAVRRARRRARRVVARRGASRARGVLWRGPRVVARVRSCASDIGEEDPVGGTLARRRADGRGDAPPRHPARRRDDPLGGPQFLHGSLPFASRERRFPADLHGDASAAERAGGNVPEFAAAGFRGTRRGVGAKPGAAGGGAGASRVASRGGGEEGRARGGGRRARRRIRGAGARRSWWRTASSAADSRCRGSSS